MNRSAFLLRIPKADRLEARPTGVLGRTFRTTADMSQYMSPHLSLGLRQEQRLTPQLIQSMNILQLPLMALEAKVREEMERNPALEEVEPEGYRETEPDPLGASADTPPEA